VRQKPANTLLFNKLKIKNTLNPYQKKDNPMKKDNSFENKSLEELKATKAKYQKITAIVAGLMTVAIIFIVYVAITTKNWGQLGTLGVIGTLLPLFISIQALDKEIKRREQNN
jgi:hypothetical protein